MNIDDMLQYLLLPTTQIGIIVALVEIVKRTILSNKKYVPIVAILIGVICGLYVYGGFVLHYGWAKGAMIGVELGLASTGLFEFGKNIFKLNLGESKKKK